jgi:hypothetical protein
MAERLPGGQTVDGRNSPSTKTAGITDGRTHAVLELLETRVKQLLAVTILFVKDILIYYDRFTSVDLRLYEDNITMGSWRANAIYTQTSSKISSGLGRAA